MNSNDPPSLRQEQIARALLLVLLYATPAIICLRSAIVGDMDIWWHLRAGEWILQHRSFPRTDQFSSYGLGKPWAAYSWLFELLVLKLYQTWSLLGLIGYTTTMVLAITIAMHRLIARLQGGFINPVILTMAGMICLLPLYTPRPWLFTILFFILEMNILMSARGSGKIGRLLWLPLIFAIWANIHIQFVDGLIVLGLAAIETLVEQCWPYRQTRLSSEKVWAILIACVLATLLNPYGWHIYQVAYELASQRGVMTYVTELQAIPFRAIQDYLLLLLALGAVAALAWTRRPPLFQTALLLLAAFISFHSQRDIWLITVVATVILASELPDKKEQTKDMPAFALPGILFIVAIILACSSLLLKITNRQLQASLADQMPVRATEMVRRSSFVGPLYNDYAWGGYFIWNLRQPVTIDGRAALHGDQRIEQSIATWNGRPEWASDPDLLSAGVVIAPIIMPLTQLLRTDKHFQLAFEDKVAAVFVRNNLQGRAAAHSTLVANRASALERQR